LECSQACGIAATQLAKHWGAQVISVVSNAQQFQIINAKFNSSTTLSTASVTPITPASPSAIKQQLLSVPTVTVIDASQTAAVDAVLDQTGHMGADCILYIPAQSFASFVDSDRARNSEERISLPDFPKITDFLVALGVFGRMVCTSAPRKLEDEDVTALFFKSASLSFVFEQAWLHSPQLGRLAHVMSEILSFVSTDILKVESVNVFRMSEADRIVDTLRSQPSHVAVVTPNL
jgi:threonine dehydrogenase-like Zn-dependent dehydrogenase